jgi:hypothetical protein
MTGQRAHVERSGFSGLQKYGGLLPIGREHLQTHVAYPKMGYLLASQPYGSEMGLESGAELWQGRDTEKLDMNELNDDFE